MSYTIPEVELLALCARTDHNGETRKKIVTLLAAKPDWEPFVSLVIQHGLTPLVYRTLRSLAAGLIPGDILQAFDIHCAATAELNRSMTEELLEMLDLLGRHDVVPIVFKGPSFGQEIYGDSALRAFGDLDFLIDQSEFEKTRCLLRDIGYREHSSLSPRRERAILHKQGQWGLTSPYGTVVEPHWKFAFHSMSVQLDYPGIRCRARTIELSGQPVQVLGKEDILLIMCIHGCKEEWRVLRQVCDVAETVRAFPALDWEGLCRSASEQGCERILFTGLLLAQKMLDAPVPEEILSKIQRDLHTPRLVQKIETRLSKGERKTLQSGHFALSRFLVRERLSDKFRYAYRTAFSPREAHFQFIDLPDRLFFLYYLIKPLHDYLLLPLWRGYQRLSR